MNRKYIISNPQIMMGKPIIDGTRITVELILEKLKAGETIQQIKKAHPKLSNTQIKEIILWELKLILSEVKNKLKKLYADNLIEVVLYGSYARGDYNINSDIDLLVVLKKINSVGKEIDNIVDEIYDLNLKYNTLISVVPVSYKDYKNINSPLLLNVRKEGVLVG